ncbi:hypothetical protein CLD22_13940 [Rubrivivax gelatinosus]|nr:hypothetical protein [Rubrivivax gelatinosus]
MANVDQSVMWARLMQSMQAELFPNGLGAGTMFSAASVARSINLNATDAGVTNYGIYSLGDIIPANSPDYNPAPSGLAASYMQFLAWIDLGGDTNPNLQSQLNIALNGDGGANPGLIAIQAGYNNTYNAAAKAYTDQKAAAASVGDTIAPFKSWALTNYPSLATAQSQLAGAQSKVDQLSNQLYGPGYQQVQLARQITGINGGAQDPMQQNNYNMQITSATYIPPGSTAAVIGQAAPSTTASTDTNVSSYVPLYQFDTAYAATYTQWQAASVAGTIGQTFHFDSSSQDYDYQASGWNASAKASWSDFFRTVSGSTSSSATAVSVDASSSAFSFDVSFVGVKAFSINPGPWWQNGSLVSTYRDKLKPGAPDFFSDAGALARRASQVVLGFEPTITIKMSAQDYSRVKSSWQTQATLTVGVGPFSFGASGGANSSKDQIHYDDASSSIRIGPIKSTMPVLLGVVSSRL